LRITSTVHSFTYSYFVLQWGFRPCGAGFVIGSIVRSNWFLAVRDLKGLHLEGAAAVVTETFPTCWEIEVMDNGNRNRTAEDCIEDENGDVYVRYVQKLVALVHIVFITMVY
jgi:hypothetical protein